MATAKDLIDRASGLLGDVDNATWPVSRLLDYLNESIKTLAEKRPEYAVTTANMNLVAGTRQTIPSDGSKFIRLLNAVDLSNVTGAAVTVFDKAAMDEFSPNWHNATSGAVRQYAPDPADIKVFWVYPPQPATPERARIEYAIDMSAITLNSTVPYPDYLHSALVDFVLYRAMSEDTDSAGQEVRAMNHYKAFMVAIHGNAAESSQ